MLAGTRDLSLHVTKPGPAGHLGLRGHLSAFLEDRLDGNRSDRENELAEMKKTVTQLQGLVADEAVIYLHGYMAGREDGDDTRPSSPG